MVSKVDIAANIGGVTLDGYVYNASGPLCTTLEELAQLAGSEVAAVMMKSCTVSPRDGNPEPRYQRLDFGAIQAMGLPNLGVNAYLEMVPDLKKLGKPVVASISGLSLEDNIDMIKAFQKSDVDLIELNLSCPNIPGKPQLAYDFCDTDTTLKNVCELGDIPLGVKLPPYFDFAHFNTVAEVLIRYPVKYVSCINSVGNTLIIDPETERTIIRAKNGFGGLSGQYIKPIGLANVRAFSQIFEGRIQVIGVGGIETGTDAFEYLLAGADAVQVGTTYEKEGASCFARIHKELCELLDKKGYTSIDDVKGKLNSNW